MINTIFLMSGLFPLAIGAGFLLKPRKMLKIQAWFRKKLEKAEKRIYKAHRAVGLAFVLMGALVVYTYFQPIWIYNMFMVARFAMGLIFPEMFDQMQQVEGTPMVCI